MSDPYRLTLVVTHADGSESRWGPDELDAQDIPTNLNFTTVNPGGFETLSCDLLRRIDRDQPDQNSFDTIAVLAPGNEVVWEGRFQQFPRQTSDGYTVTPGGEGWSAHLSDNKAFREIYVDRDLSRWQGPSVQRQINDIGASFTTDGASLEPDASTGSPALKLAINDTWASTARPLRLGVYDAAGIDISGIYYAWMRSPTVDNTNTNWEWYVLADADDLFSGADNTGNLRAAGPSFGGLTLTGPGRRFAAVQLNFDIAGGVAGTEYAIYWTCLAVFGRHGLTLRGSNTLTSSQGVYASDVIAHALANGAPLLTYTTGADGSIQPTSIVLEQLAFLDPTTAQEVVKRCNAVHLWDWFVWENKTFYFQEPGTGRSVTWTVRLDEGTHISDDGPAAQDLINGVVVSFTDPSGQKRYAGPVGSGLHVEDAVLQDDSDDNAATVHGIVQKWDVLELSQPATDAGAVDIGAVYLTERSAPQHRGQAVASGMVRHPTQGPRPSWAIRSGDYVQFVDPIDDSIGQPRRIIKTEYSHEQRANTLTLDSTPFTLDALLSLLDATLLNV